MTLIDNKAQTIQQLSAKKESSTEFKPTPPQQAIIDHFEGHGLVVAGPGSGKTVTLIAHVKKLVARNIAPADIWIMAFNRDISSKLREKIQNELKEKAPQTTTIHKFILTQTHKFGPQLLGGFEIADGLGDVGTTNLLWKEIARRLKQKHKIEKTNEGKKIDIRHVKKPLWNQLRDYWLTSEKPKDTLFEKYKLEVERIKNIFRIIFLDELALKFLDTLKSNPSFKKAVVLPRIVIDEFQDLNPTEHKILQEFREAGAVFVVFGDDDQAVNEWRRAHADFIRDFDESYKPTQYPLARDRRCPKEILDLADEFVKGLPRLAKPSGHAPHQGQLDIVNFTTDKEEKEGIVKIVEKYVSTFPEFKEKPQVLILAGFTGTYKKQSRIDEIIQLLNDSKINDVTGDTKNDPLDNEWGLAFKSLSLMLVKEISPLNLAAWLSVTNRSCLEKVNKYIEECERGGHLIDFLQAFSNLMKGDKKLEEIFNQILTLKENSKNEKFDPDLIIKFIPEKLDRRAEAESFVRGLWEESKKSFSEEVGNLDIGNEKKSNLGSKFLRFLAKYLEEEIRKPQIGRVHVTTYRKAKGLEADLVIVTSVDSREFSDDAQKRRLLYVSATRSKKNLVMTFADERSGQRIFSGLKSGKSRGKSVFFRSPIIPSEYPTKVFSEKWLLQWKPI